MLWRNGLTLVFLLFLLLSLVGQAVAGARLFDEEQRAAGLDPVGLLAYVGSSSFAVDLAENWQSEYLQFFLFVVATVWLVQVGSPESKPLDGVGRESDEEQRVGEHAGPGAPSWARRRGWRLAVYSRSLSLVMGGIFLLAWVAQSVAGAAAYSEEQMRDLQDPVTWWQYVRMPEFWSRTLQNWQSEFLAVASMVLFAVYLRERGSSQSKPVGASHTTTGVDG
ncbi:hypothetical protein SAMN05421867_11762 [Cellulomonas marina]|uniref:Uncharacterized protein n=1 Tax=Cellulomonas marina TaxID=988821 RepID=A0A1I1AFX2_9CELL|nr:hypothetical protein SAMN05421867_11762 [Cellulomonas marina]